MTYSTQSSRLIISGEPKPFQYLRYWMELDLNGRDDVSWITVRVHRLSCSIRSDISALYMTVSSTHTDTLKQCWMSTYYF